ncbi:MAG TPA: ATP-binding protein [Kofleriaceae bacterium]
MSSSAIPVVSSLAALVELTANLVRAKDTIEVATTLRRSVKWMLPVDQVALVIATTDGFRLMPANTPIIPRGAIADVLVQRSARVLNESECGSLIGEPQLSTMMLFPLVDDGNVGILILGARDPAAFAELDRGTCHLLAHNVVAALRMVRLLERERAVREAAENAIRGRAQMIQAVTHDLRNPLGVVMALFDMVKIDNPDAIPVEDADAISISLKRMKGLIDELLDIAKSQSGGLQLRRTRGDVRPVVNEAVSAARSLVRGHVLDIALASEPMIGNFDEARIARVLGNLVSNAIKYSPQGGHIGIVTTRIANWAEIRVTDSGIGIPAADLPRVFERFHRAGNVGKIDGNGIGLASSREVVIAHGGSLDVESVEGSGSTFIVRLPLAA